MAKILINDGIHPKGVELLENAGHTVNLTKVPQEELEDQLPSYDAICVRSATKVRKDLIAKCPNLKAIGRGGVGLDNIDVEFAKSKGIDVLNTPAASSRSVAELAFAHLLSVSRSVYQSNRAMPDQGNKEFKSLKKSYSKGFEIHEKVIGIIGFGRIGQATAEMAVGLGMKVLPVDPFIKNAKIRLGNSEIGLDVNLETVGMDEMLQHADIVTLHIPNIGKYVLGENEFGKMKKGSVLINCSRGGTVDESAMITALNDGTLSAAGLDVFENEPTPLQEILSHPRVSLTPHIGASTNEAQEKIGIELAEKLIAALA